MTYNDAIKEIFEDSIRVKKEFLSGEGMIDQVALAADMIVKCLKRNGKIIVFGNGGSAADSQHFAAELVVRFEKERKALPCIALSTNTSSITAAANDYDFDKIFSRQIEALAGPLDIIVAISTSGNSPNVIEGVKQAKESDIPIVVLTGKDGGELAAMADLAIVVKENRTARIQEVHETIIHALCRIIDDEF
jgi:D-sedoheptulose 7-phosphate isomerase